MAEQSEGVRRRLLDLLLEKVEEDTYPSSTMLDLIELLVTRVIESRRPAWQREEVRR